MGLFSNLFRKNAVQINDVDYTHPHIVWNGWGLMNFKPFTGILFAETYLWMCLEKIIKGLSNVSFTSSKENVVANEIVRFLENNATLLFNSYVRNGFIAVTYEKISRESDNMRFSLLQTDKIVKDTYGRVVNPDCVVVYSPEYQLNLKTPVMMCRPILDVLDRLCGTLVATTSTLNVLPIISGNSIPASPQFKADLEASMSNDYGWGDKQMRYFLSRQEVKVDALDLGVDKLQLRDNILAKFKELLNYWGIPVQLVVDDASTYNNLVESRKEFYGTCVRFYAEQILKVGQNLLTASNVFLPQNTLNYFYRNVPEMESTVSGFCEESGAYLDLLKRFSENGVDVSDEVARVYNEVKKRVIEI